MNKLNLRIISTHDTEANWIAASEFIPKAGELIIYDKDENNSYERFKIGDGVTKVNELPFTIDEVINKFFDVSNNVIYMDAGRIV